MSFWITRKGPGNQKNIFTVSIPWELALLLILFLIAAVITFLKN